MAHVDVLRHGNGTVGTRSTRQGHTVYFYTIAVILMGHLNEKNIKLDKSCLTFSLTPLIV